MRSMGRGKEASLPGQHPSLPTRCRSRSRPSPSTSKGRKSCVVFKPATAARITPVPLLRASPVLMVMVTAVVVAVVVVVVVVIVVDAVGERVRPVAKEPTPNKKSVRHSLKARCLPEL